MSDSSQDFSSHETFNRSVKSRHVHRVEDDDNTGIICAQLDKFGISTKHIMEKLDTLDMKFEKISTPQPQPMIERNDLNVTNDVHWVQGNSNNPYSSTYNPEWKNHPNFGWVGLNKNPQMQE